MLDALCSSHAQKAEEEAAFLLTQLEDPLHRVNCVLSSMMPLRKDAGEFLTMMLPVLEKPEGLPVLIRWQEELLNAFLPLLEQEVDNARRMQRLYPVTARAALPVAVLANRCAREALQVIISAAQKAQRPEAAALLEVLEAYRRSIEVLLDAPYGSIELASLADWDALAGRLAAAARGGR